MLKIIAGVLLDWVCEAFYAGMKAMVLVFCVGGLVLVTAAWSILVLEFITS